MSVAAYDFLRAPWFGPLVWIVSQIVRLFRPATLEELEAEGLRGGTQDDTFAC